jgi:hypothetical protein
VIASRAVSDISAFPVAYQRKACVSRRRGGPAGVLVVAPLPEAQLLFGQRVEELGSDGRQTGVEPELPLRLGRDRDQPRDGHLPARDDDLLPSLGALEELRQVGLRGVHGHDRHGLSGRG